jgi:hypothetical protein
MALRVLDTVVTGHEFESLNWLSPYAIGGAVVVLAAIARHSITAEPGVGLGL